VRAFVSRLIDLPKRWARWALRKELADIRRALELAEHDARMERFLRQLWQGRWEQLHYSVHGAGAKPAFVDFSANEAVPQ
jgi:hypothetical protein